MKDIGTTLVDNVDLLTGFSCSIEAIVQWWNYINVDLEGPTASLLCLERGSSHASEIFSK